ncbi:MAG: hypothetical protein WAU24_11820, partial [Chitinophagaceae bacterium]
MKYILYLFVLISFLNLSCSFDKQENDNNMQKPGNYINAGMLNPAAFDTIIDGKAIQLFTLKNNDITVDIINYGARVVRLMVPDKNGKPTDIAIGYGSIKPYTEGNDTYFG